MCIYLSNLFTLSAPPPPRSPLLVIDFRPPLCEFSYSVFYAPTPYPPQSHFPSQTKRTANPDMFVPMIQREKKMMAACYSKALGLGPMNQDLGQQQQLPGSHMAFRCLDGDAQYRLLDACMEQYAMDSGDKRPWFQRFIHAMNWNRKLDVNEEGYRYFNYEGVLARGHYVDQVGL